MDLGADTQTQTLAVRQARYAVGVQASVFCRDANISHASVMFSDVHLFRSCDCETQVSHPDQIVVPLACREVCRWLQNHAISKLPPPLGRDVINIWVSS